VKLADVNDFYPLEPGMLLSGLVRAKVSMRGKTSQPQSMKGSGVLELQDAVVGSTDAPIRKLNGTIAFNNQVLETKQLRMKCGSSDLSMSFALRNYLSAIFPSTLEKGKPKSAKPSMSLSLTSTYFESTPSKEPLVIPPIDIDATVAISKLVYKGKEPFECTDVRGNVSASEKIIRLKNLSLRALEGAMNASGTIDLRNSRQPQFDISMGIDRVDGHSLLRRFTSFGEHLFGMVSFTTTVSGTLDDTLGLVPSSLSGEGSLRLADGKLTGYPVMNQLASFFGLPELRDLTFKSWSHTFKISDGKINIPDLKIATSGNDFLLAGWQGFDGSLDYRLAVKLSGALSNRFMGSGVAAQVADLFKDKDGRVMLFLLVGGTTEAPKFRWDTKAAQEKLRERVAGEVEKKKGEIREKAKEGLQQKLEEGKKKIEEQLKKLLKKP
ncbi:MAG: AsmA-like C-terminal region-containing protein, partial [Bacteroidota bacterium]